MGVPLPSVKKCVTPGEKIGVVEEYEVGPGAFVDGGSIYSSFWGRTLVDLEQRRVIVQPTKAIVLPRKGDRAVALVLSVSTSMAETKILFLNEQVPRSTFTAFLRASEVPTRNMYDVLKPGEIIKAVVKSSKIPVQLSWKNCSECGVLLSYCNECGEILEALGKKLRCPRCGKEFKKPISPNYGEIPVGEI